MKWAALAPAFWPVAGHALDWTADTTRYLSDPSFLPYKGQIESLSEYEYFNLNETWKNQSGASTEHAFNYGHSFSQSFFYGITDRLRLSAAADYAADWTKYSYYGAQSSFITYNEGFSNPSLGLTYRAIDQRRSPISLDGTLQYTPAVQSYSAQSAFAEFAVSRETKSATIRGFADATYRGSYSTLDAFNGGTRDVSSSWSYGLGLDSQLRLSRRWAVNSGLAVSTNTGETNTNAAANVDYLDKHDPSVEAYLAAFFDIVPNKAVVGLRYEHDFLGDDHRSGTTNGTWTDQARDSYAVNLRLLF